LLETLVWNLSTVLSALVAVKLIAAGLASTYPALTASLLFVPLRSVALMALHSDDNLYAWAFVLTLPVLSAFAVWTGLEVYKLVLEAYSGLSVLGRRSLAATATVGGAIAFLTVQMGLRVPNEPYPALRLVFLLDTWVSGVVLFFLLTLAGFLLWFPVPLRRNVVIYAFGLCAKLTAACAGYGVRVFAGADYRAMGGTVMMAANVAIFLAWLVWLTRSGESTLPEGTIRRSPQDRERLLEQLNSLNAMVRSAKNP
jgi:hypothetical protein